MLAHGSVGALLRHCQCRWGLLLEQDGVGSVALCGTKDCAAKRGPW